MAISSENKPNNNWDYKRWENYLINIYRFEDLEKELEGCTNIIWSYIDTEEEYSVYLDGGENWHYLLVGKFIIKPYMQNIDNKQYLVDYDKYNDYYKIYNNPYTNDYIAIFSPHKPKYFHNYPDGTGNYPLSKEEYKNYIIEKWRKNRVPVLPPQ